jgi:hypothetical protein
MNRAALNAWAQEMLGLTSLGNTDVVLDETAVF